MAEELRTRAESLSVILQSLATLVAVAQRELADLAADLPAKSWRNSWRLDMQLLPPGGNPGRGAAAAAPATRTLPVPETSLQQVLQAKVLQRLEVA